jgi:hypothetical protein
MPEISAAVGPPPCPNHAHDVSLIQAILRVIRNPKGQPYVTFGYDGVFTPKGATNKAIEALQADHKTLAGPPPEKPGVVEKYSRTFKKMVELLPVTHKEMMTIPNQKFVYLAGSASAAQQSEMRVSGHPKFQGDFKTKVAALIRKMYETYKIVLCVIPDKNLGGFRTFDDQRALMDVAGATGAGPGESNHNFGNGADVGFEDLAWLQGTGEPKKDAYWLNALSTAKPEVARELWQLRNRLTTLSPSRKSGDLVHLQTFDDGNVSMGHSLAHLMSENGAMYWAFSGGIYKSNFGLADSTEMFTVGTAKNIWDRHLNVVESSLAKALNQAHQRREAGGLPDYEEEIYQEVISTAPKLSPEFKASDIKTAHCDVMRARFKQDFVLAEASYTLWKPVDKAGNLL